MRNDSRLSGEEWLEHMTVHVGEPAIDAVMAEGEARVIEAELMKNGGVVKVVCHGADGP
jgi:hypothetical protein